MEKIKLYFEGNDYCSDFFKSFVIHSDVAFDDCDFVVSSNFDFGKSIKKNIQNSLNKYINYDKKVIVFLVSDYNNELNIPKNVFLFRTALYKSIKKQNEFVLPYIWESFYDDFEPLTKTAKPIVGFCGNVKNNSGRRESTMASIESDNLICSNFIKHIGFGGGKIELVERFKKNILQSHFTISNRGLGNFSMRFYQVLALGRIPVLLDTDMAFPFNEIIDWNKYIITSKSENQLAEKIKHFWSVTTDRDLIAIQQNCKQLFDDYFSYAGLGNQIEKLLQTEKNIPRIIKSEQAISFKFPHLRYKVNKKIASLKLMFHQKK